MIEFDPRVELNAAGFPVYIEPLKPSMLRGWSSNNPQDVDTINRMLALYNRQTPSDLAELAKGHLAAFNNINPLTQPALYQSEMTRLMDTAGSNKVLVASARRIQERTELVESVGGKITETQLFIYVNEGPAPCEGCVQINGEGPVTYEWFVANDILPG